MSVLYCAFILRLSGPFWLSILARYTKLSAQDKVCLFFDQLGERAASDIKEELNEQVELVRVPNHIGQQLPDIVKSRLLGSDHNVIIIAIQQEQDIWHRQEKAS